MAVRLFTQVGAWLTAPAATVAGLNHRRRAQLLATIFLILTPLGVVIAALPSFFEPTRSLWQAPNVHWALVSVLVVLVLYGLSRTSWYEWTGYAVLILASIFTLGAALINPAGIDYHAFFYLIIPVFLAAFFYSSRLTLVTAVGNGIAIGMIALVHPDSDFYQIVAGPLSFLSLITIFVLLLRQYEQQLVADHQQLLAESEARYRALFETTQNRLHEQTVIRKASAAITQTLDLDTVLQQIVEQLGQAVNATSAYLSTYDQTRHTCTVLAEYFGPGVSPAERISDRGVTYDLSAVFPQTLQRLQNGEPVVEQLSDPTLSARRREHLQQHGGQMVLLLPLQVGGRLIAFAEAWYNQLRPALTPDELAMSQSITQQAAIAIQNAQLYEQAQREVLERKQAEVMLQRRYHQIETIYQLSDFVSDAESIEEIYERAIEGIQRAVETDRASMLIFDPDGVLRFKAWRGLSVAYRKMMEGHTPWTPETQNPQPILVPDVEQDTTLGDYCGAITHEGIRALAFIPLVYHTRLLGKFMLYFNQPHQFRDTEIHLAQTIAGQVAFAIERKRAQQALQESEQRYRRLVQQARVGIFEYDLLHDKFISVNDILCEYTGYLRTELLKMTLDDLLTPESQALYRRRISHLRTHRAVPDSVELRVKRKDQQDLWTIFTDSYVSDNGVPQRTVVVVNDISARKHAEELLQRAQKMESLGVMAGGLAHDFNNLLVTMLGQSSVALRHLPAEHAAQGHLHKAMHAAEKARELTRQMLDYSGQGHLEVQPLSLNQLLDEHVGLLEATLPEHVALCVEQGQHLPLIEADPGQIQQILLNLVINASEAINGQPGQVIITTACLEAAADDLRLLQYTGEILPAGTYVRLTVQDTGAGIDSHTLTKIFDPFFTTKFTGRGLGLAVVLGIVQGHNGGIQVQSTVGAGTAFHLLFPASPVLPTLVESTMDKSTRAAKSRQVLVIDDESAVRETLRDIFQLEGIAMLDASDGASGLALYRAHAPEIDLVLLDLSMPGMSGEETFRALRQMNPQVKLILVSGYTESEAARRLGKEYHSRFLQNLSPLSICSMKSNAN